MSRLVVLLLAACMSFACVAGVPEVRVVIQGHRFVPAEIAIPANTKVKLLVVNQDATPEEFESHELNREKVVMGNATTPVFVGPLKPGRYPFFGDFHADTAQGALIVR